MTFHRLSSCCCCFFFNDTATTEIYTLSLHDALPISRKTGRCCAWSMTRSGWTGPPRDRKSTRLNSSHVESSYADFCLKKKKKTNRAGALHLGEQGYHLRSSI